MPSEGVLVHEGHGRALGWTVILERKAVCFSVLYAIGIPERYRALSALKSDIIESIYLVKRHVAFDFVPGCLAIRTPLRFTRRLLRQALHDARVAVNLTTLGALRYALDD